MIPVFEKSEQPTMAAFNERIEQANTDIETAQSTADGVAKRLKVVTGSYTGTLSSGTSTTKTINVDGYPQVLFFQREKKSNVGKETEPVNCSMRITGTFAMLSAPAQSDGVSSSVYASFVSANFGENYIQLTADWNLIDNSDYKYYYTVLCTD